MPSSKMSLPGLIFLLTLVLAYNAYDDYTALPPSEVVETAEERAASQLNVPADAVAKLMPDGRVLLKDGSIRKPGS